MHSQRDAAKWPEFTALLRKPRRVPRGALPGARARRRRAIARRAARRCSRSGGSSARSAARDMIEFLRTLPLSVWELARRLVRVRAAQGGGRGRAAFRTCSRDRARAARASCCCTISSARRRARCAAASRGGDGPDAFTRGGRARGEAARRDDSAPAPPSRAFSCRTTRSRASCLQSGEEIAARARAVDRRSRADASATGSIRSGSIPSSCAPWRTSATAAARRSCSTRSMRSPSSPGSSATDALAGIVSLTPGPRRRSSAPPMRPSTATVRRAPARRAHRSDAALARPRARRTGTSLVARVQYAPYRLKDGATWDDGAPGRAGRDASTAAIEAIAPGLPLTHPRIASALSPRDLEERFGLREGAPSQGELALDQILFMRPVAGWGRHATPIAGLYLGGAGTHPGPGDPRRRGLARGGADAASVERSGR